MEKKRRRLCFSLSAHPFEQQHGKRRRRGCYCKKEIHLIRLTGDPGERFLQTDETNRRREAKIINERSPS
jgi:hypothetical protein